MLHQYLFLLFLISLANTINEPTNFDYTEHGDNWQNCPKNGSNQSPIQLPDSKSTSQQTLSYLFSEFSQTQGTANYLNTTIYINTTTDFGSTYTKIIHGESASFKATEIRFRMHSEHKTKERYYPLEVQIFHTELYSTSRNFKLAVSLLFDIDSSSSSTFLQSVIDGYEDGKTSSKISFNLGDLMTKNNIEDFWFYLGSITIPPCSNGRLNWLVSRKIYKMSANQEQSLRKILSQGKEDWDGNYRSVQPVNDKVGFYHLSPIRDL